MKTQEEAKQSEEDAFVDQFQAVASETIKPYFDQVAAELITRGHFAVVTENKSQLDKGGPTLVLGISLVFSPRGR